jgi:hypothetical protein
VREDFLAASHFFTKAKVFKENFAFQDHDRQPVACDRPLRNGGKKPSGPQLFEPVFVSGLTANRVGNSSAGLPLLPRREANNTHLEHYSLDNALNEY